MILIEGDERVLSGFPEDLSASALKQLKALGVEVSTRRAREKSDRSRVGRRGKFIPCRVKIWAAGNEASFVGKTLGVPVDRAGRVIVNDDLTIPGHPEVQVIGDLANFVSPATGKPLPGVSPVAMQQGRHAARNILRHDRRPEAAALLLLGQGQHGDHRPQQSGGRPELPALQRIPGLAGLAFCPRPFLVGFRNRFAVLFQWAWAYFTFNKGARLITRNFQAEQRPPA